jgi:hypothetical protein
MNNDYDKYDMVLLFDESVSPNTILEDNTDPRLLPPSKPYGKDTYGQFIGQDPNSQLSLGPVIKSQLSGMGKNYYVDVFDFGSDVTVKVTYSNPKTGLSASAAFLIKYNTKEGRGTIKSNSVRYRTISSHSEAISYIRNRANTLQSRTNSTS